MTDSNCCQCFPLVNPYQHWHGKGPKQWSHSDKPARQKKYREQVCEGWVKWRITTPANPSSTGEAKWCIQHALLDRITLVIETLSCLLITYRIKPEADTQSPPCSCPTDLTGTIPRMSLPSWMILKPLSWVFCSSPHIPCHFFPLGFCFQNFLWNIFLSLPVTFKCHLL